MRICLVTQEDIFYLPPFLDRVIEARKNDIAALLILPAFNESAVKMVRRMYAFYGPRDFLLRGFHYVGLKILATFGRMVGSARLAARSVAGVGWKHRIPVCRPKDINSEEFLEHLRDNIRPDVIVSVAASQIFKKQILAVPRLGCINVHTGPLPRYRGMLPTFWVLLNGETETAVSVHYMGAKLDDGEIILQTRIDISPEDTLDSLIRRAKQVGVDALLEALRRIEAGTVSPLPNDRSQSTYFSFPTPKDVERLRAMGRRLL